MAKKNLEEEIIEVWDKRKIAIGIILLAAIVGGAIYAKKYILPQSAVQQTDSGTNKGVQGASTVSTPQSFSLPTSSDVQEQIAKLQTQVTHLSVQDVASSSPQVQQIISQLEALPKTPLNTAKEACMQLCSRL